MRKRLWIVSHSFVQVVRAMTAAPVSIRPLMRYGVWIPHRSAAKLMPNTDNPNAA